MITHHPDGEAKAWNIAGPSVLVTTMGKGVDGNPAAPGDDYEARRYLAAGVSGVRDVHNEMWVRQSPTPSDTPPPGQERPRGRAA
jgi:hypothetical protein